MIAQRNPLRTFLFALVAAAAVSISLSACSSGTEPGDANVETGHTKHKNPDRLNPNSKGSSDRGSTSEEERDESKVRENDQENYYKGTKKSDREKR